MKTVAIIVAGGTGKRYSGRGRASYKQFISLGGVPVAIRTLKVFESLDSVKEIVFVAPAEKISYSKRLFKKYKFKKISRVIAGGRFRQESVYNGLQALDGSTDIVAVHDGVRPLVNRSLIHDCINEAEKHGAAILAVPVKDTIKTGRKMFIEKTVDRGSLWSVQTPQCFKYGILSKAYKKAIKEKYRGSDDAGLVERMGVRVKIVMGSYENVKITTSEDLLFAEALIKK